MSITLALTRQLPLPPITIGKQPVDIIVLGEVSELPETIRVVCSTALDTVDAQFINDLPASVGLIANLGVGTDNVDLQAAEKRGIQVSNTPVVTEDTADLAFALLLNTARRVGEQERFARSGLWPQSGPSGALGTRVHGKTLGLIGFGDIGQAVARRGIGFGMKILYWNRSAKPEAEKSLDVERIDKLEDIIGRSDFISVHTPLTEQTRHLIGASQLQQCKPGAILINTARGPVVDERALIVALENGKLAGAGLDVFEQEPIISKGLLELNQVVLTPHIGSATTECRMDIVRRGISNIVSFLEKGVVLDPVSATA